MKNVLLYIWQLPQNLLGLILYAFFKANRQVESVCKENSRVIARIPQWGFGISLGRYIIIGQVNDFDTTLKHEIGHCVQSLRCGPLYLLIVGIPSLWRGLMLSRGKGLKWYYSGWPEKHADKLGGVEREA